MTWLLLSLLSLPGLLVILWLWILQDIAKGD